MDYYQNLITEKSWKILKELRKNHNFVLIGGWAVWIWTHALKSKDIDIIIDYDELAKLEKEYEVVKNNRLLKYEIKNEEIDIDIYLPFYSDLGVAVEEIVEYKTAKEGFQVIQKEVLLMLKQYAYSQRHGSVKGEKDKVDILLLALEEDFDWNRYSQLLKEFNLPEFKKDLKKLLSQTYEIAEINIDRHIFAKKKKLIFSKL
ncbi:hypothetical protein HY030_03895 [Candidatus Gottesmanbacteria bacterium]|nr:hypothetical protein [Candidatus Gottesmanbacteria bacterium]